MFVAHVDGKEESVLISSSAHQTGHTSGQCSVSCDVILGLPFCLESSGTDRALPGRAVQLLQVLLVFVLDLRFDLDLDNFCKNNNNKLLSGEMFKIVLKRKQRHRFVFSLVSIGLRVRCEDERRKHRFGCMHSIIVKKFFWLRKCFRKRARPRSLSDGVLFSQMFLQQVPSSGNVTALLERAGDGQLEVNGLDVFPKVRRLLRPLAARQTDEVIG